MQILVVSDTLYYVCEYVTAMKLSTADTIRGDGKNLHNKLFLQMKQLLVFVLIFAVYTAHGFSQKGIASSNAGQGRIVRYATDIKGVAENTKEILVNILFQINPEDSASNFTFILPDAVKVLVTNYSVKVYGVKGDVVYREKRKKLNSSELSGFNPYTFIQRFSRAGLMVEWDFRIVVHNPRGTYRWPSISGAISRIDEASLRLMFDNAGSTKYETNMATDEEKDFSSGNFFYLWSLKKLTPAGGEFNGEYIVSPYVQLHFE